MKHTTLTTDTLTRFEKTVDISTLTDKQIKKVEYCAYCANMGANSNEEAWQRFNKIVVKYI